MSTSMSARSLVLTFARIVSFSIAGFHSIWCRNGCGGGGDDGAASASCTTNALPSHFSSYEYWFLNSQWATFYLFYQKPCFSFRSFSFVWSVGIQPNTFRWLLLPILWSIWFAQFYLHIFILVQGVWKICPKEKKTNVEEECTTNKWCK